MKTFKKLEKKNQVIQTYSVSQTHWSHK